MSGHCSNVVDNIDDDDVHEDEDDEADGDAGEEYDMDDRWSS